MAEPVIFPPEVPHTSPLEHSPRQLEAFLEVREAIAQQRDLPPLFHDLSPRLHSLMGFVRVVPQGITDTELQFMQRVASQVAVAVDNALNFETSQAYQQQLARERDRLRVLLDINNVLVTSREFPELFRGIVSALERVVHHDYTSLALLDTATGMLKIHALDFPGHQGLLNRE